MLNPVANGPSLSLTEQANLTPGRSNYLGLMITFRNCSGEAPPRTAQYGVVFLFGDLLQVDTAHAQIQHAGASLTPRPLNPGR